ncbi:hypothetical protein D3875_15620 [Deinococcus cavernae]|uniref:Uncharacterized protein n=1 Tax=Deinococcus cavernae TaxID=2320857 RepID=A0A418V9F4_9DEIO|nr:DUF5691 domain-containing protein [Deinococcus cavernae]RJF72758.1 hypothetical protein D3875_15620 [Deinococcus cavernae]
MKDVQDLLAAALVGTSRTTPPLHAGTLLSEQLNAIQGDPEGVLLSRAALAGAVECAGRRAAPLQHDVPTPAPVDTLPEAPARVARHLPIVMNTPVVNEWLQLCAQAGWRIPHSALPGLLDLARFDTTLRVNLRPVLGERGVWLASLNPDWRFNATTFSEDAWLTATEAQKEGLFRDLREKIPGAARDLLTQQFKTEKAGARKRLLSVLQDTWTDEDATLEPLLENTLADRSREVQELARVLLQSLPGSAYNARMTERVAGMLQQEKVGLLGKLLGKQKVSLHLPETLDADAGRDGLTAIDPHKRVALDRFRELIQNTHPQALADALHLTPEQLFDLIQALGAADQLRWATLATRHVPTANVLQPCYPDDLALLQISAPETIAGRIGTHLQGQPDASHLLTLLSVLPGAWPVDLSEQVLNVIHGQVSRANQHQNDYRWEAVMQNAAHHAHPHASTAPLPPQEDSDDYHATYLRLRYAAMLRLLEQRRLMHDDFQEAQS